MIIIMIANKLNDIILLFNSFIIIILIVINESKNNI